MRVKAEFFNHRGELLYSEDVTYALKDLCNLTPEQLLDFQNGSKEDYEYYCYVEEVLCTPVYNDIEREFSYDGEDIDEYYLTFE